MRNANDDARPGPADTAGTHSNEGHEPWCDRHQHALTQSGGFPDSACVGSAIKVGKVGGWVTGNGPQAGAHIVLDWQSLAIESEPLTLTEAADLLGFLERALSEAGAR